MAKFSRSEVLRHLGDAPEKVGADLEAFSDAARVLSSDHPRLIDTHPMEWIGVCNGAVAATAGDFNGLIAKLDRDGVPSSKTIVRFIDRTEKTFIL